jgi:hypothetical protein
MGPAAVLCREKVLTNAPLRSCQVLKAYLQVSVKNFTYPTGFGRSSSSLPPLVARLFQTSQTASPSSRKTPCHCQKMSGMIDFELCNCFREQFWEVGI